MTEFLVELYVSGTDPTAVATTAQRAQHAAVELTAAGIPVHFVRSIFVPADETCLFLFEAESIEAVRDAALPRGDLVRPPRRDGLHCARPNRR